MMGFLKIFTKSTEDFILLPHVKLTTAPQTPLLRYGEMGVFKTSRIFVTEASEPNPSTPRSSRSPVFAFLSGFSRVVLMGEGERRRRLGPLARRLLCEDIGRRFSPSPYLSAVELLAVPLAAPLAAFCLASAFCSFCTIFRSWPPGLCLFVFCSASFLDRCFPEWPENMALSWS